MIITQEKSKRVVSSHDFDSVECTIDAEDMRYVASLLRNNYSNPPLAVVREITANALDANIEAKASRRIEATIPTRMNPHFCVRDFGSGLSQEDVFGLYSKYGKSTKRTSNSYIGAFGIGKFAPLSYGNNFTCVSYHGGKKTSYNVFVDENDDTKIVKLHEELSEEPSGLSIEVAIGDDDVDNFRTICKTFFKFFSEEEMPIFVGIGDDEKFLVEYDIVMESEEKSWHIINDNEGYWGKNHHEAHAFMGRVHYPINTGSIDFDAVCKLDNDDGETDAGYLRELCQQDNLYIRFDIGELKLHHSRESLEYNKQTKLSIVERLRAVRHDIEQIAKKKLDGATCLWDAKTKFAQVLNALPSSLQNIFKDSFEWKGVKIDSMTFDRPYSHYETIIITEYEKQTDADATDGYKIKSHKNSRIFPKDTTVLGVQDTSSSHGNALKARTLFNENEDAETVVFIHGNTHDANEFIFDEKGMGFNLIGKDKIAYTSQVEKAKLQSGTRASGESRASVPLFQFDGTITGYRSRINTNYWLNEKDNIDELEQDSNSLVYVPIANYKIVKENGKGQEEEVSLGTLATDYRKMESLDKKNFPKIYGVRRKDCKGLDKSIWRSWDDYKVEFTKKHLLKHRKKLEEGQAQLAFTEHKFEMTHFRKLENVLTNTKLSKWTSSLDPEHDLITARNICEEGAKEDSDINILYKLLQELKQSDKDWIAKNFPNEYNWKEYDYLCKDIQDRYPLLVNISHEIYGWQSMDERNFGENIIDYISMCDNRGSEE
jgi:hypothetical protein